MTRGQAVSGLERLTFPGGDVDISEFVAEHAGGRTPSTIRPLRIEGQMSEATDCLWIIGGRRVSGEERVVVLLRFGILVEVPVDEITAGEAQALLRGDEISLLNEGS